MTSALANPMQTKDASKLMADHFGSVIQFPELLDIDENRMSVWIAFADGNKRDGVGDLTEVGGIRTDRHRVNPIVLFDHGKGNHHFATWPIGLCTDPDTGAYTVEIDPHTRLARANAFFYRGRGMAGVEQEKNSEFALYCEQLYDLIAKRYIRGGSFGYQIIDARQLQPDYQMGYPAGQHLLITLLLELGPVVLPANQDTVRKCLCMGDCCGKPLSPYLRKSFEMYAEPNTKTVVGFETKATPEGPYHSDYTDKPHYLIQTERNKHPVHAVVAEGEQPSSATRVFPSKREANAHLNENGFRKKKGLPSDEITPEKARQMLKDGTAHGHPLTDKQRRMLGAAAGKNKSIFPGDMGFWHEEEEEAERKGVKYRDLSGTDMTLGERITAVPKVIAGAAAGGPVGAAMAANQASSDAAAKRNGTKGYADTGEQIGQHVGGKIGRAVGGHFDKKAFGELRLKYRSTKGLRRRVKRSRPGASTFWTRDLKGCAIAAKKYGLKAVHLGTHQSGAAKVRLEGHDEAIDGVVRAFGIRGVKSMEVDTKQHTVCNGCGGRGYKLNSNDRKVICAGCGGKGKTPKMPPRPSTGSKAQAIDAPPGAGRERTSLENRSLANSPMGSELVLTGDEGEVNTDQPLKTVQRKAMKQNTKAMGDDGMSPEDEPVDERPDDDVVQDETPDYSEPDAGADTGEPEEKYSMQVLRKMHQDAATLLKQYDEMKGPLEHEEISSHLQSKLEDLVEDIEAIEALVEKHHPDAAPLDVNGDTGTGSDDLESSDEMVGDEGEASENEEQDIPTPEEAVEGMANHKSLTIKHLKAKVKGVCKTCGGHGNVPIKKPERGDDRQTKRCTACNGVGKTPPKTKEFPSTRDENTATLGIEDGHKPGFEEHHETGKATGKSFPSTRGENTETLGIEGSHKPGFEEYDESGKATGKKSGDFPSTEDEDKEDLGVEGEDKPGFEEYHEPGKAHGSKGLRPHERYHVKGAHGFLGELAHTQDFGHRHRLDAHHYGKLLDDIGQRFEHEFKNFAEQDKEDENVHVNDPDSNEQAEPEAEGEEKGMQSKSCNPATEINKESSQVGVTKPTSPNSHVKPGQDTSHMAHGKKPDWPTAPSGDHSSYYGGKGMVDDALGAVGMGDDKKNFSEAEHEDSEAHVQHPSSNPMADIDHYVAIKGAARYLKDLGYTHDFGDKHRDEAGRHHKMLQGVLGEGFQPAEEQVDQVNVEHPRGEISVKHLIAVTKQQASDRKELIRKLARLAPILVN